ALFGTESERDQRRGALLGAIFIGSGLMQRWQAAFIFIPYFLLETFFRLKVEYDKNKGKKTELKASLFKLLRLVLPTILVFLFLTVTREVFYSNEPYRSGMIHDNMRVITGDYPMEFFTDVKDKAKALEVRESEYKAALSWLHADTEIMDKEKFEAIGKVGARIDFPLTLKGFAACLAKMLKDILESPQRLGIPVLILLLLALLSFLRRQSTEEGIKILITLLGSFIIMYYFVSRGRAPHRVWMPVELATLILILCSGKKERKDRGYDIFLCILSFLLSAAILSKGFSELHFHKLTTAFDSRTAADDGALPYDLKEGSLYLVAGGNEFKGRKGEETFETGWIRVCKTYTDQGKLAGKEFYRQYIPLGWWFYGQPYYKSLLKELGAENPMTALFDREDTYLLLYGDDRYDLNMIIEFIYDHYGNMNVKRIESNSEYSLYRFSR
nr:hypothetical protein [Lachnospiraceae bacterium]